MTVVAYDSMDLHPDRLLGDDFTGHADFASWYASLPGKGYWTRNNGAAGVLDNAIPFNSHFSLRKPRGTANRISALWTGDPTGFTSTVTATALWMKTWVYMDATAISNNGLNNDGPLLATLPFMDVTDAPDYVISSAYWQQVFGFANPGWIVATNSNDNLSATSMTVESLRGRWLPVIVKSEILPSIGAGLRNRNRLWSEGGVRLIDATETIDGGGVTTAFFDELCFWLKFSAPASAVPGFVQNPELSCGMYEWVTGCNPYSGLQDYEGCPGCAQYHPMVI